jgi:hypothetical protein
MSSSVTAVEGGHIEIIEASNSIIRQIAEARNEAKRDEPRDPVTEPPPAENPKDTVGSTKLPLHLWPTTASAVGCIALLNGALKYGRSNWRVVGVRASIYVDACHRHLAAWFEGEECDEEGVPHLGAALACLAILVDCSAAGKLRDDRQFPGGHREFLAGLSPLVARLQEQHSGKSPKHCTIGDAA